MNTNGEKYGLLIHKTFIIRAENSMVNKRHMYETFEA